MGGALIKGNEASGVAISEQGDRRTGAVGSPVVSAVMPRGILLTSSNACIVVVTCKRCLLLAQLEADLAERGSVICDVRSDCYGIALTQMQLLAYVEGIH